MTINFKAIMAERIAEMTPTERQRYEDRLAAEQKKHDETHFLIGQEVFTNHDHSIGRDVERPVGFYFRHDPMGVPLLECTNGITGYEAWFVSELLETLKVYAEQPANTFDVCMGTRGRYARLTVPADQLLELVQQYAPVGTTKAA